MIAVSGVKASLDSSTSSEALRDNAVLRHGCNPSSASCSSYVALDVDLARESFLRIRSKTGIVLVRGVPKYWRSKSGVGCFQKWRLLLVNDSPII